MTDRHVAGPDGATDETRDRAELEAVIERLQASEQQLRALEERTRGILDSAPFPIAVVDTDDNQILYWNKRALSLFGHTAPTAAEWYEIAYPDPVYRNEVVERWKPALELALKSDDPVNTGAFRVTCSDGSFRLCELHAAFLANDLIVSFHDVTDREKNAEKLHSTVEELRATNQQLMASEQQLRATNEELLASNQQLRATEEALTLEGELLRESEARFRAVFEQAAVGIARLAPDGSWLEVNRTLCDIVGYSREELLARTFADITHPEDLGQDLDYVGQMLAGELEAYTMEKRYFRKDGSIVWINLTASLVRDSAGSPAYFISVIEDISGEKAANEQLRVSESFLDAVVEESPFAMWIADDTGTVIRTNRSLRSTLGLTDGEIVGKYSLLEDDNLRDQGVMPQVEAVFGQLEPAHFTIPWKAERAGNSAFGGAKDLDIDVSMFPVAGADGELRYVVCQWVDVSEQKRLENRLKREHQESQWLLDSMIDPFVIFDSVFDETGAFVSYRFVYINRAYEEITEVSQGEVEGKTVHEVWPETEDSWVESYGLTAVTGKTQRFEMYHEPTGKLYYCCVYRPWDTTSRFCVTFEDITDRKWVERDLQDKTARLQESEETLRALTHRLQAIREQEREVLARDLHDELGTALTAHRMDLAQLREDATRENNPLAPRLEPLFESVDEAGQLIRDYCMQLHSPVLDLMGLGAAIRSHAELVAEKVPAKFEIQVDDTELMLGPEVDINVFRIAQEALTNVLRHAEAERIRVTFGGGGDGKPLLEVADDGIGIKEERRSGASMGLLGMRERAMAIGGKFTVECPDTGGTIVRLEL